ncbi:MAG: N-acetylmuramoyl-L-alanine amidase CwlD [Dehalobacterium sp.]|jgi:N-acetylmuramoyl-L-alanine amidase
MQTVFFRVIKFPKYFVPVLVIVMALGLIISSYFSYQQQNRKMEVISLSLVHRLIVVDAGHGGIDPGAVGAAGTLEKDVNLAIAQKLCDHLSQAGAVVIMTREDDQSFSNKKKADLDARIALAETNQAQIFVSIQGNALKSSRWSGAQTFYYPGSQEGERLAVTIQEEIERILKNTKRKARPHTEAYILRQLTMPTVVVEVGFLSNPEEEKMLNDPQYQSRMAWAIYSGLARYFAEE